jgi:hypothetical protein
MNRAGTATASGLSIPEYGHQTFPAIATIVTRRIRCDMYSPRMIDSGISSSSPQVLMSVERGAFPSRHGSRRNEAERRWAYPHLGFRARTVRY